MNKKLSLNETLQRIKEISGIVTEIDWEDQFSDVKKTCMPLDKVVDYLNRVIVNRELSTADREKFDASMPFVHAKSRLIGTEFQEVDIPTFIARMSEPPNNVVNTNDKMLKSGGKNDFVYKTGLPAFRGIAYDIENKKFFIINTCPGAGKCRQGCYALSGNYIQYPASYDSMTRRLNYLLNFPDEYEKRLYDELKAKCVEHKAIQGYKFRVMFRWNDSGDFFTKRYIKMANNVMNKLKSEGYNIISAAHTKIADVTKNTDFDSTSFSADANKQQLSQVNPDEQKFSERFPYDQFKDLNLAKIDDFETLRERVAEYYDANLDNVISYEDMMSTKDLGVPKYLVIITPDDGDDALYRKDVKKIIHTEH